MFASSLRSAYTGPLKDGKGWAAEPGACLGFSGQEPAVRGMVHFPGRARQVFVWQHAKHCLRAAQERCDASLWTSFCFLSKAGL